MNQEKQKEQDTKQLVEYLKIRDNALSEKEAARLAKLETGKKLQEQYLKQIVY